MTTQKLSDKGDLLYDQSQGTPDTYTSNNMNAFSQSMFGTPNIVFSPVGKGNLNMKN